MSDEKKHLAEGYYDAVCTGEVQFGHSSKGTEQVGIGLMVDDTFVTSILYFSDAAKQASIDKLKACGWSGSGIIADQIKGKTVRVGVKYEEYEGKMQLRVSIFDRSGGMQFQNKMDAQKQASFMKELEAAAKVAPTAKKPAGGYPADWDKPGKPTTQGGSGFSID